MAEVILTHHQARQVERFGRGGDRDRDVIYAGAMRSADGEAGRRDIARRVHFYSKSQRITAVKRKT